MQWVQRRLDVDHVTLLDVDMGAHMMYSGWNIVDTAGLVDVPIARHSDYNRKFIREYVFKERKPDFAHCHGGWARTSKIPRNSEWKRDYMEIPGYPVSRRKLHIGNHIRRDLFIHPETKAERNQGWRFEGSVQLTSVDVSSPYVAPGGALFIEQRWSLLESREANVLAIFALVQNGNIVYTGAFQPGYRWYDMDQWDEDEIIVGKFPMPISKEASLGQYNLWVTVLDSGTGNNLAIEAKSDSTTLAQGLQWLNLDTSITIAKDALTKAEEVRQGSLELSTSGDCHQSWALWKSATRHIYRNRNWQNSFQSEHRTAVANCFLDRAIEESDEFKQKDWLVLARKWDHNIKGLSELAKPLAESLDVQGQALMIAEDWIGAYDAFSEAMTLDPSRSHTRRRAENARDKRLNIEAPYKKEDKK